MLKLKNFRGSRHGFTIVELLIVIVVIAILAAISVVAYSGIQARARDTIRKQDLAALAKATQLYAVDNGGDKAEYRCGMEMTGYWGNGWLHQDYDGAGPGVSINDCLMNSGYLTKVLRDPSGVDECIGVTCFAYMKVSCPSGTWYLAHLETLPQDTTLTDDKCIPDWDSTYGMNYAVRVQ
jgi:prepilin-type N-terminal cleavage/methylation domain-containing protein